MVKDKKIQFPTIPKRNWWLLRERFKISMPKTVDDEYLSTVLNMDKISARANILPSLALIKLIDENGNPTELANKWRDDKEYPKVCEEIIKNVYPQELLDAVPEPIKYKESAKRWFTNRTRAGKSAVSKIASFYFLLCQAEPAKAKEIAVEPNKRKKKAAPKRAVKPEGKSAEEPSLEGTGKGDLPKHKYPNVHVNIQIHITPEVSPEQIDQIFSSMAKHFYKNK